MTDNTTEKNLEELVEDSTPTPTETPVEQVEEVIEVFTDTETGLTADQVASRVADGKINGEQTIKTKSIPQILRENILTFFNFVFVAFAVILLFFTFIEFNQVDDKMTVETHFDIAGFGNFGFMILIIGNCVVGVVQGIRSKRTMDKLSLLSAPKAIVVRDGEEKEIAIEDIVLDDVTILSTGKQICADGIVVDGTIEVNESLITGEPDAIVKNPGDKVMSGSFVVSGKAKCQVIHVGQDNFAMKIMAGAKYTNLA